MVPVAPIITDIKFDFILHMRSISVVWSSYFVNFRTSFLICNNSRYCYFINLDFLYTLLSYNGYIVVTIKYYCTSKCPVEISINIFFQFSTLYAAISFDPLSYRLIHCHIVWSTVISFDSLSYRLIHCHIIWSTVISFDPLSYRLIHGHIVWSTVIQ
jgi:hypothetical protein